MCGIIGRINRQAHAPHFRVADVEPLAHRGPDDQGIYNDDHANLGHRRLSIIDLSPSGHQPMESADGRYVIVYNGEVYNYLELRAQLKAESVSFKTPNDTEVVLNAFIHWGPACLQQFRGMFAFAIWDKQTQRLFIARDRCGEKPFIYYKDESSFIFASEFKGLVPLLPEMPILDPAAVDMYLHYQYTPEPMTLLKGVHKLSAAHYAIFDLKTWSLTMTEYWNLFSIKADPSLTKQDIRDELDTAVRLCLRSDVPVGVALSAGIDSSAITALASAHYGAPMHAFCVGYPGRPAYDERAEAQEIARSFGCIFHEVELPTDQFTNIFQDFVGILDEPIADIAAFGHYAVPKSCADFGIKVLLTGIGGDEVFWGYDWARAAVSLNQNRKIFDTLALSVSPFMNIRAFYVLLYRLSRTRKIPRELREFCRSLLASVDQETPKDQLIFKAVTGAPEFTKNMSVGQGWYGPTMHTLPQHNAYRATQISEDMDIEDIPTTIMHLLFKTWLVSNCLNLGDRVSMAVSVETRLPFLDVRLIEKVVAWRKHRPDHNDGQKAVLREILKDVLPEKIVRRPKSGFVPPVIKWLKAITETYGGCLSDGHLAAQGIILPDAFHQIANNKNAPFQGHILYRLILLETWYETMSARHRKAQGERADNFQAKYALHSPG